MRLILREGRTNARADEESVNGSRGTTARSRAPDEAARYLTYTVLMFTNSWMPKSASSRP
jgi:hypothetical protein